MRHPFGFVSGLILDVIVCPFSFTHVKRDHFGLRTSFRLSMLPLLARGGEGGFRVTDSRIVLTIIRL